MRIALLCPGPSLPRTFDPAAGYDVTVGVNRAILCHPCDWFASFDASTVKTLAVPTDKVFTRAHCFPAGCDGVALETVIGDYPAVRLWEAGMFSACGALLLCSWLGADVIDVYGTDWTPGPDFDGKASPGDWRVAERWRRETRVWDKIAGVLQSQGVSVKRINE